MREPRPYCHSMCWTRKFIWEKSTATVFVLNKSVKWLFVRESLQTGFFIQLPKGKISCFVGSIYSVCLVYLSINFHALAVWDCRKHSYSTSEQNVWRQNVWRTTTKKNHVCTIKSGNELIEGKNSKQQEWKWWKNGLTKQIYNHIELSRKINGGESYSINHSSCA